jgi:hypothetical protein
METVDRKMTLFRAPTWLSSKVENRIERKHCFFFQRHNTVLYHRRENGTLKSWKGPCRQEVER